MVSTAAYLTALGKQLLWFAGVATVIAVAEHLVPAAPNPVVRERLGNFLIVIAWSFPLAGLLSLASFVPELMLSEGLIGVVFGDWHPSSVGGLIGATAVYAFVGTRSSTGRTAPSTRSRGSGRRTRCTTTTTRRPRFATRCGAGRWDSSSCICRHR